MNRMHGLAWAALPFSLAAGLVMAGCGTPGAPQPPSLKLPDRVADLAATRAGNAVKLTWTMPKKNTDKLLLKGDMPVRMCRSQGTGPCEQAGTDLQLAPGTDGVFTETLPQALVAGAPRPLKYFVELKNRNGRSAGMSNVAVVLAGEAPAPVAGLAAEVRKDGVILRWTRAAATQDSPQTAVRLHRKLLTPTAVKQDKGLLAPPPEPLEQNLLVNSGADRTEAGRAIDKEIRFGKTYEYTAQRVARISLDGQTLELASDPSAPVRIETQDVFPPAVPTGLAAVATVGEAGAGTSIDLGWQPATDADMAGYAVYRREGDAAWQRISPPQPVVGPAFHDAQTLPGHTYSYAVTAIDQGGHESARSAEAQETVPNP